MCISENCTCSRQRLWRRMRRRKGKFFFMFTCACILFLYWIMENFFSETKKFATYCEPIDVVYTWVNGSDPYFIASAIKWSGDVNFDPARFDDKNELKYSLRSLERYAPWVRHIYIVTNQIPNWLDLTYERVSIIPHELLTPNLDLLPTFSSAAIETFLHRIPNLSKRFLYLNDDIFLGTPLYPEDLFTASEGVQVYQAWMVPDCAEDCPWTYIGDGACDRHCNIAACQYDGGDCSATGAQAHVIDSEELKENYQKNTTQIIVRRFPLRKQFRKHKNAASFKELMLQKNFTTLTELQRLVEAFNKQLNAQALHTTELANSKPTVKSEKHISPADIAHKSTKDIYSQSLIYTNMLLNRHYGFKPRNVLAHVGFLLDRDIIDAMQAKLADEILLTASHRFRAVNDLQFAFAYYSFLMSEQYTRSVEQIFDEFDTDGSGTWSDREVRTFLTRMFPIVDWPAMHFFEEVIGNCTRNMLAEDAHISRNIIFSTLAYERYEDSNLAILTFILKKMNALLRKFMNRPYCGLLSKCLKAICHRLEQGLTIVNNVSEDMADGPTITRELVIKCPLLAEAMTANLATHSKYKYKVNPKRNAHSNFMMLTSNISEVTYELDRIRRSPRKFNCINDNLDPAQVEDNILIRNLLEDFYISFFPRRSKFELQANYRNRFSTWQEYQRWRLRKRAALVIGYSATILLVLFLLRFLCLHKAKVVRRCAHRVFRI